MWVLDIRTFQEYDQRHVCDAINVPTPMPPLDIRARQVLLARLQRLNLPVGDTIYVYCAKGIRSKIAAALLRQLGHTVVDLGGIEDLRNYQVNFPYTMCTSLSKTR